MTMISKKFPTAALIDGDHNWYTVVNELRMLRDNARAGREPLPVLILHDVGWPYGRRDLYYDPSTIPEEHRQPHRKAGMRLGRAELVDHLSFYSSAKAERLLGWDHDRLTA